MSLDPVLVLLRYFNRPLLAVCVNRIGQLSIEETTRLKSFDLSQEIKVDENGQVNVAYYFDVGYGRADLYVGSASSCGSAFKALSFAKMMMNVIESSYSENLTVFFRKADDALNFVAEILLNGSQYDLNDFYEVRQSLQEVSKNFPLTKAGEAKLEEIDSQLQERFVEKMFQMNEDNELPSFLDKNKVPPKFRRCN